MCGRFVRTRSTAEIGREFGIPSPDLELAPSYNIAPSDEIAVIVDEGSRKIRSCRWGLVPAWAKNNNDAHRLINARAETVTVKPSFRDSFKKHRCLVVTDGFYEWRKEAGRKLPVFIHMKSGKSFCLAGLYSLRITGSGSHACTSTIITTEANDTVRPVHDRMPVIIPRESYDIWLDPAIQDSSVLKQILSPCSQTEEMEAYDVTLSVNSPSYNSPDCIKPAG